MSDEIRLDGIGVAPGVLETIVTLAAQDVEGVTGICESKLARVVPKGTNKGVVVEVAEEGPLSVAIHVNVVYGRPIREVAADLQSAVADALASQTGQQVSAVDVFVDGVSFPS